MHFGELVPCGRELRGRVAQQPRLAERWNGTQWSLEITPAPSGPEQTRFHGVACVNPSNCTIVGESITGGEFSASLIEHWNGTAWSIASTKLSPPGAE